MQSFADIVEELDAVTLNKRRNLKLITHENVESSASKLKAFMELQPIYPWTNRFAQGSFQIIPGVFRKDKQIKLLDEHIDNLQDFASEVNTELITGKSGHSYPGLGNEIEDLNYAHSSAYKLFATRYEEHKILQKYSTNELSTFIKHLRDDNNETTPTNKDILSMTGLQRTQFLVETKNQDAVKVEDFIVLHKASQITV